MEDAGPVPGMHQLPAVIRFVRPASFGELEPGVVNKVPVAGGVVAGDQRLGKIGQISKALLGLAVSEIRFQPLRGNDLHLDPVRDDGGHFDKRAEVLRAKLRPRHAIRNHQNSQMTPAQSIDRRCRGEPQIAQVRSFRKIGRNLLYYPGRCEVGGEGESLQIFPICAA